MGKVNIPSFAVILKQDSVCKCWNFPWAKPLKQLLIQGPGKVSLGISNQKVVFHMVSEKVLTAS